MEHIMTKGHDALTVGQVGNKIAQDGTVWLLAWQEQRHGDSYIFSVVVHMTKKTSRYDYKYMVHILVEGLGHRSGESLETRMPTGISAAAGQQGQRA